jgi:competence protein ComEC
MTSVWNEIPFLKFLLPLIAGIAVSVCFQWHIPLPVYVPAALWLLYLVLGILYNHKMSYKIQWIAGAVITVFMGISGYQLAALQFPHNDSRYFATQLNEKNLMSGIVTEPAQEKANTVKVIVNINSIKNDDHWFPCNGKAVLMLEKDSAARLLETGNEILFNGSLKKIPPPLNPGEFDYAAYMQKHGVFYSSYIKSTSWNLISQSNGNLLMVFSMGLRKKLQNVLHTSELNSREYAVISALLLGATDNLDPETIKAYQGSGAMHILSVSGMHVGVIYMVLNFLLFFFNKFRYGRYPKALILIAFVWFYAMLSGMSPSVVRAATMFSFVAFGKVLSKDVNIYNILAASAFLLLMITPNYLTDVGFQLSYLAVFGIVAIYPLIYKTIHVRNYVLDKIWGLISVSLAAQIITAPLSLYYFHQFPNYFILTNLVAVPLSALVMYCGILYLIFSGVPFLSMALGKALNFLVLWLNNSIGFVEGLPHSVSNDISINVAQLIILYFVIAALYYALVWRNARSFVFSLCCLLGVFILQTGNRMQAYQQKEIVVYNVKKATVLGFYESPQALFLVDSAIYSYPGKMDFHVKNHRITHPLNHYELLDIPDAKKIEKHGFYRNGSIVNFFGKTLVLINSDVQAPSPFFVDFVVLSNNPRIDLKEIFSIFNPQALIIDASNNATNTRRWKTICSTLGKNCYITSEQGAWQYKF